MLRWLRRNGELVICDDYSFWLNGLGWVPGAMLAYIAKHHSELVSEYIEHVYQTTYDYDALIKYDHPKDSNDSND